MCRESLYITVELWFLQSITRLRQSESTVPGRTVDVGAAAIRRICEFLSFIQGESAPCHLIVPAWRKANDRVFWRRIVATATPLVIRCRHCIVGDPIRSPSSNWFTAK